MEMKATLIRTTAILLLAFALAAPARASLKEGWYLSRGKANMKIHNYKAAIEAFEKLVALNPNHQEPSTPITRRGCGSWERPTSARASPTRPSAITTAT
ncbi:MAG: tetratricopeptide repeat protein [Desulfosarcinaceae bacterium]